MSGKLHQCQVWDVSRGGAKLVVGADVAVPTAFELQFAPNTLLAKRCKIVWQHARIFGIQFVD